MASVLVLLVVVAGVGIALYCMVRERIEANRQRHAVALIAGSPGASEVNPQHLAEL